jgi:hypothetical protein
MQTTRRNKHTSSYWDTYGTIYGTIFLLVIIATIIGISVCLGRAISKAYDKTEYVVVVNDKWTKKDSSKDKYLVSVTDVDNESEQMVFEITDSLFAWRWDSSDLYAKIEPGKIYRMTVGGSRVPIFSWYPNIYEADQIDVVIDETESEKGILNE